MYDQKKKCFVRRDFDMTCQWIDYDVLSAEYVLHNDKQEFARIGSEFISYWCKDNGWSDWFNGEEYEHNIKPYYVKLFFASLLFDGLDMNSMTDCWVVKKALGVS